MFKPFKTLLKWLLHHVVGVLAQVLVDCVKANGTNGCNGGDPTAAYAYILDHGVPDETCSNYEVTASLTTSLVRPSAS